MTDDEAMAKVTEYVIASQLMTQDSTGGPAVFSSLRVTWFVLHMRIVFVEEANRLIREHDLLPRLRAAAMKLKGDPRNCPRCGRAGESVPKTEAEVRATFRCHGCGYHWLAPRRITIEEES